MTTVRDRAGPPRSEHVPVSVRRRGGAIVDFDPERIASAVARAMAEVGRAPGGLPARVAREVSEEMGAASTRPVSVEELQDAVERRLMAAGLDDVVRAYVLYRRRRAELREQKELLQVTDELKLPLAAVVVLKERYLRREPDGRASESTGEMIERVAHHVAAGEEVHRPGSSAHWAEEFAGAMRRADFLPNSPTLMNAGSRIGLLSGCVVLPVEDSLRSIFAAVSAAAVVHQAGAGTGFSFSHLRAAGEMVESTGGRASGPVSFLSLFEQAAEVVSQGGRRRAASMAVLDASHPDIEEFLAAKSTPGTLSHFNLSVAVRDGFLRSVARRGRQRLVEPRTGRTVKEVDAESLFARICEAAHRSGDPGLVFLDAIDRGNVLSELGPIEATNPCGEVPLRPYESCNLGSVNLANFVSGGRVDFARLEGTVALAVRFLDDVIEVSRYPLPELESAALATRKIGLGVMGLAELLASLGLPYDSHAAVRAVGRILERIRAAAEAASAELAEERGPFPAFARSSLAGAGAAARRNGQLMSIAPTGTISLLANTTSGIEPIFAVSYVRRILGRHLFETNALFERVARERGFYSEDLVSEIASTGSVQGLDRVPPEVQAAFPTAMEIAPEWHLRMQAAVQRHCDGAVSKTINLPETATVEDVRRIYLSAWRSGLKGITVYRDNSRPGQVLSLRHGDGAAVSVAEGFSGGCASDRCSP